MTPERSAHFVAKVDAWFRPRRHLFPPMACDHMGTVQRESTPECTRTYPVCMHCGCREVAA